MAKKGTLYLLPLPLGDDADHVLPGYIYPILEELEVFIAERIRTARRYLRRMCPEKDLDNPQFFELGKHTPYESLPNMLAPLLAGKDTGLMSEAGVPGVADPGANIVALAHKAGIKVVPLVGPSSLLLALMASGMPGQQFAFHGYLPAKSNQLPDAVRKLEKDSRHSQRTQLFIEAPYRNDQLFKTLLEQLSPSTRLCVAVDITLSTESVRTLSIKEWRKVTAPQLHKRPAVFLLFAG